MKPLQIQMQFSVSVVLYILLCGCAGNLSESKTLRNSSGVYQGIEYEEKLMVPGINMTGTPVMGVITNGVNAPDSLLLSVNDSNETLNQNVDTNYCNLLRQQAISQGLFNPSTQSIHFFQSCCTISLQTGDSITYRIITPGDSSTFTFIGTTQQDLANGLPLTSFTEVQNNQLTYFGAAVPAMSHWALMFCGLLMILFALRFLLRN